MGVVQDANIGAIRDLLGNLLAGMIQQPATAALAAAPHISRSVLTP